MTTPETVETANASLTRALFRTGWHYRASWRGVLVLSTIALAAGLALNWSWLIAVGIAPAILTALPCLVMCGAGLCMNKLISRGGSCESQQVDRSQADLTEERRSTDA